MRFDPPLKKKRPAFLIRFWMRFVTTQRSGKFVRSSVTNLVNTAIQPIARNQCNIVLSQPHAEQTSQASTLRPWLNALDDSENQCILFFSGLAIHPHFRKERAWVRGSIPKLRIPLSIS